ncbi:hypothetical protein RvY_12129-2 [Ramazzottius varieornatus]|uniref:Receptor ligand binding region domain-containing protein n=1 Tax=Ramazzottius varieornatus TaxID=947166 RepID=A0A1D1VIH1_RAMVA|nr:hypothetical protein RvY_12129-2 [Ramazzottius varieornatus]
MDKLMAAFEICIDSSGEGAPTLADRQRGSTWITTYFGCANYPELYRSLFAKYGWSKIFVLIGLQAVVPRYRLCSVLFVKYMRQNPWIQLYVNEITPEKPNHDEVLRLFNSSSRGKPFWPSLVLCTSVCGFRKLQ